MHVDYAVNEERGLNYRPEFRDVESDRLVRLAAAHLAILALEATPDQMVSEEMERELMSHVGADAVSLLKPDRGRLMLMVEKPGPGVVSFDKVAQSTRQSSSPSGNRSRSAHRAIASPSA